MTNDAPALVQLATRIPRDLHLRLKLHCVRSENSVMGFVTEALTEKLQREGGTRSPRARG